MNGFVTPPNHLNHLFIVTQGEEPVIIRKYKRLITHSVWNNADTETIIIGITVI